MIDDSVERWQQADEEVRKNLPPGVKLVRTMRGHKGYIGRIAWSPDGRILASPSEDRTIRLWDTETGKLIRKLEGHVGGIYSVAFNLNGQLLSGGMGSPSVFLWNADTGQMITTLDYGAICSVAFDKQGAQFACGGSDGLLHLIDVRNGQIHNTKFVINESNQVSKSTQFVTGWIKSISFDPSGNLIVCGDENRILSLWDASNGCLWENLVGRAGDIVAVAFDSNGTSIFSASQDGAIREWAAKSGKLIRSIEGHTGPIQCLGLSPNGLLIASKAGMGDNTIRIWSRQTGAEIVAIQELGSGMWSPGIAFHPYLPYLATVGSDPDTLEDEHAGRKTLRDRLIHIWELDFDVLLDQQSEPSAHYINAKVILVGDTGVGKTGLSLVLNNQPYRETDSTAGRHVWTLDSRKVEVNGKSVQTRETLLWDLAGQPGYRVIHQLHLNEVAVALVVFDARSEIDPLSGVRHWERALRLAQQRQGTSNVNMKKFLVSARNDRGGVSIGEDRLQMVLKEFGFDGYFKTSAKVGWNIKELRAAIEHAIAWENLPEVASSQLFADIKSFLLDIKKTGQLLASVSELYNDFVRQRPDTAEKVINLRDQFDTCIGRLENRDLIRRLTFGGYILLQPELLDAYASAMVNAAKEEPDGLGSIAEEIALGGKFFVPEEQKIKDPNQEQLLLHATVEELICHDLALRENANDGRYLVFPSQFNRDYEDAPEPKGKALAITFDGPVQSLYATLTVRLGHSGLFTIGRVEMWRNAAVFTAKAGGKCGLFLQEFAEARGRLILFFDEHVSQETRFHFEEFVLAHAKLRSLDGSVELKRFFVCSNGHPVPDDYVKILLGQGKKEFPCPCGAVVPLTEPKESIRFRSEVKAMDESADFQRDFDAFVMSAKGETNTRSFQKWAGGERVTLAIVFTDVVGSTALGEEIRDESMNKVRRAHFTQSRRLIDRFEGREIKTIGDSFMAAFKSVSAALDYAMTLQKSTGDPQIQIRAGIHIGPMTVEEGDVFGGTVNFASRVIGAIKGAEIWLSDRSKEDIDRLGATKHKQLCWEQHDGIAMKGFPGVFKLWSVK